MHLLIPFACSHAPGCELVLPSLQLPHLERLLQRLDAVGSDMGAASSLSPPHERVLAGTLGLGATDGCIAWAAHEARQAGHRVEGSAWAWVTPVHWDVGADQITMADPHTLDLHEDDSRALLAAMQPYFAGDGITLDYAAPTRWLARSPLFDKLPSASLDRVAGRDIGPWMPPVSDLRRLQNEMQMLLYTNPVNDERVARGLATVNSFWVSGTGSLPAAYEPRSLPAAYESRSLPAAADSGSGGVVVATTLRAAAIRNDWTDWAQRWGDLDRQQCKALLQTLDAGEASQLTLCGERSALRFDLAPAGLLARWRRRFTRTTLQDLQHQL